MVQYKYNMKKEQIVSFREEITEKNHKELIVSLELERKMFQKELSLQETMSERIEVRKDLVKCEKKIKELEKYRERKDLGIRNYPESCMERMLSDEQVHGI